MAYEAALLLDADPETKFALTFCWPGPGQAQLPLFRLAYAGDPVHFKLYLASI